MSLATSSDVKPYTYPYYHPSPGPYAGGPHLGLDGHWYAAAVGQVTAPPPVSGNTAGSSHQGLNPTYYNPPHLRNAGGGGGEGVIMMQQQFPVGCDMVKSPYYRDWTVEEMGNIRPVGSGPHHSAAVAAADHHNMMFSQQSPGQPTSAIPVLIAVVF